eukprot:14538626-Alexandrium_andersonii.AAC.1
MPVSPPCALEWEPERFHWAVPGILSLIPRGRNPSLRDAVMNGACAACPADIDLKATTHQHAKRQRHHTATPTPQ